MVVVLLALTVAAVYFGKESKPDRHSPATPARTLPTETAREKSAGKDPTRPVSSSAHWAPAPDSAEAKLIATLLDGGLPLETRRQAAFALARLDSEESIRALKTAFANGPSYLRAAIAEALGQSQNPQAHEWLLELINDKDETAARGAVRGLAFQNDSQSLSVLGKLLFDDQHPPGIRTEAALALGNMSQPGALDVLKQAISSIHDPGIVENLLDGLSERPFSETSDIFNQYLNSDAPSESKVAALEALANTEGNVAPLLLKHLGDADSDVREAAAWSLATVESDADISPQLEGYLAKETDPSIRAYLYQALGNQTGANPAAVLNLVQSESDVGARDAGFEALAGALSRSSSPDAISYFDETAVPGLENTALNATTELEKRLAAVFALGRAGTAQSLNALRQLASSTADPKVAAAASQALKNRNSSNR